MKFVTDHPFFRAKFEECETKINEMTETVRSRTAGLPENLKQMFDAQIAKQAGHIRNGYKKKYGRSKYVPH